MKKNFEIPKQTRDEAIASIRRYFDENMEEPIGELVAGNLLNYFLEEIGPIIYNRAVSDAQTLITRRVEDLPAELFEEEMTYWTKKKRR